MSINEPQLPSHNITATPISINEPAVLSEYLTVDSIDPTSAALGDPDLTLHVYGTNFVKGLSILFNQGAEPTTFVSGTELTTTVRPSTAGQTGEFPVTVAAGEHAYDPPQTFTFTETEEPPPEE